MNHFFFYAKIDVFFFQDPFWLSKMAEYDENYGCFKVGLEIPKKVGVFLAVDVGPSHCSLTL